jgi:hypothetical protein
VHPDREQFLGFYAWAGSNATLFGYTEDSNFLPDAFPLVRATRGRLHVGRRERSGYAQARLQQRLRRGASRR